MLLRRIPMTMPIVQPWEGRDQQWGTRIGIVWTLSPSHGAWPKKIFMRWSP